MPSRTRCSPSMKPLSEVKISSVSSSSPASRSAPRSRATPSSTASSDARRCRRVSASAAISPLLEPRPAPERGRLVGDVGLVERRRARQRGAEEGAAWRAAGTVESHVRRIAEVARAARVRGDVGRPQEERRGPARRRMKASERVGDLVRLVAAAGDSSRAVARSACSRRSGRWSGRAAPAKSVQPGGTSGGSRVAVAVEVLADHARRVAGALQPDGQRLGAVEPREAAERRRGSTARRGCARSGRSGTSRATGSTRDSETTEFAKVTPSPPISARVRGMRDQVGGRLVVGLDHHDVRRRGRRGREEQRRAGAPSPPAHRDESMGVGAPPRYVRVG